jgi:hypothetical protein
MNETEKPGAPPKGDRRALDAARADRRTSYGQQAKTEAPAPAFVSPQEGDRRVLGVARPDRRDNYDVRKGQSLISVFLLGVIVGMAGLAGGMWISEDTGSANKEAMVAQAPQAPQAPQVPNNGSPAAPVQQLQSMNMNMAQASPRIAPTGLADGEDDFDALIAEAEAGNCPQVPKVPWWGNTSHERIAKFVNLKNNGDWVSYAAKWQNQVDRLEDIYKRDKGAVIRKEEITLRGKKLGDYVSKLKVRVAIIHCLARAEGANSL